MQPYTQASELADLEEGSQSEAGAMSPSHHGSLASCSFLTTLALLPPSHKRAAKLQTSGDS